MKITAHARDRMEEMGVDEDEVQACLDDPDLSWPTRYGAHGERNGHQRYSYVRGRISVIATDRTVVTVLWNQPDERDDNRHSEATAP